MGRFDELVTALDATDERQTVVTSVRQPAALRKALRAAVALGMAPTANEATNDAVRARLEAFAQRMALDEHYARHPDARPSLAEVAQALAELDGNPLARDPVLLAEAAREVRLARADADADDVLLWAAGMLAHGWSRPAMAGGEGASRLEVS